MSNYEVKNIKSFRGMDTDGFNATLYRDGKKVALAIQDGSGGEMTLEWLDWKEPKVNFKVYNYNDEELVQCGTPEEALLAEHVKDMFYPDGSAFSGKPLRMGMDGFVEDLVCKVQENKQSLRLCKNKTLYRVEGQKDGDWWTIKAPFTKELRARIVAKEPKLVEFLNERMGQVAL